MMFGQNRQQLRQFYHDVWQKQQNKDVLSALETTVAQVINEHPEYHQIFNSDASLEHEYFVEQGQTNPFLHMGLHISLHEQLSTDRPLGIRQLYQKIQAKKKSIVVYPTVEEIPLVLKNLKPEGLLIQVGCSSEDEAKVVMAQLGWK